jgi:hypothetical protein
MEVQMSVTEFIAGQVETLLYDKLHQLLGVIAEDYDLSHGELVEKYLVKTRKTAPPSFIYEKTKEAEEEPVKPKEKAKAKPKRAVKVTQKKAESDEQAKDERTGKCTGVTAKGTACKNKAQGDSCFCHLHNKNKPLGDKPVKEKKAKAEKPVKEKVKRTAATKKVQPEHTHALDEAAEDCDLCETHGNALEGEQEFVIDEAEVKRTALREMLQAEMGDIEVTDDMLDEFEAEIDAEAADEESEDPEEGEVEGEEELD